MNIVTTLEDLPRYSNENALEFNIRVRNELKKESFDIFIEQLVPNRGDGRRGKIDIVAKKDGLVYAIEIDRKSPRQKSIYKITNYPCDVRLVVLRDLYRVLEF